MSMWASLASADNCSKGSCVLLVVFSVELSGKYTVIWDGPVCGKSNVLLTKCDVAPESIIISSSFLFICCSHCCPILLVHLFVLAR